MLENDYGNDSIIFIDEEPKPDIEKVNSIIKQVLELARSYKINNFENIQKSIIKIINNSEINPSNIKNKNGETLTHLIIKEGDLESLKLIIESYIQLLGFTSLFFDWFLSEDNDGQTILEICVKYSNNKDIIKYIYEIVSKTTDSNFRLKENRKGIFHYAAIYNKIYPIIYFYEKLQRFFKNTLIIDVPTKDGMTPLLYACRNGNKEISNLLIDLGANINWKDNKGNTCLHYAVSSGNDSLVKKLIMFGADKKSKNEKEETPLDIALKSNNNKIIGILKDKKCPIIMSLFNIENKEINSLKNNGNNFFILFIIIFFIVLYKWYILIKIYYVYQYNNKYDIMPFIYDMDTIRTICRNVFPGQEYKECEINNNAIQLYIQSTNDTKSIINNIKQLFNEDTIGYNYLEVFYILQWIFTLFEVIILIIILKFLFFPKDIYMKQNEISKTTTMIKLYEESKNFCPKCRIIKTDKTVHCIICDRCVRDFDHHCDTLNICINADNMSLYKKFIYIFLAYIIYSIIHFAYSK
jgi:ankyrin repeat protein